MENTLQVAEGNGLGAPSLAAMPSSGNWVVEMEKMLGEADSGAPSVETAIRGHSIYRVPEYIKDMTNRKAYQPQVVSLGPFHHGEPALLPMEVHKSRAVAHLVKRSGKPWREFIAAVEEIAGQLEGAYENLDKKKWPRDRFVGLMVTDGCFLLELMRAYKLRWEVEDEYGTNDPVFSTHGCLYLYGEIVSDMLLIENQVPLLLLQRLNTCAPPDLGTDGDGGQVSINSMVYNFLGHTITEGTLDSDQPGLLLHPLDVVHKSISVNRRGRDGTETDTDTPNMPTATQLREAGIRFKLSDTIGITGAVRFEGGILKFPKMLLYDHAERMFLNLMAFEQLHPGAGNDVTAFVSFLDNFINTAKDVELLRSKGIIENGLGSDEAVANMINSTLTKGAVMDDDSSLHDVVRKVNAYCRKPWNSWRASLIHTYFSNPWVFISLVAATILLVATLVQTVYAVMAFHKS